MARLMIRSAAALALCLAAFAATAGKRCTVDPMTDENMCYVGGDMVGIGHAAELRSAGDNLYLSVFTTTSAAVWARGVEVRIDDTPLVRLESRSVGRSHVTCAGFICHWSNYATVPLPRSLLARMATARTIKVRAYGDGIGAVMPLEPKLWAKYATAVGVSAADARGAPSLADDARGARIAAQAAHGGIGGNTMQRWPETEGTQPIQSTPDPATAANPNPPNPNPGTPNPTNPAERNNPEPGTTQPDTNAPRPRTPDEAEQDQPRR